MPSTAGWIGAQHWFAAQLRGPAGAVIRNPRILLALLLIAGFSVGVRGWMTDGHRAGFYQIEFSPAVSLACGKGFNAVYAERQGVIAAFLGGKSERLNCEVAFSEENKPTLGRANILQYQTFGQQYLFSWLWRVFGFTWNVTAFVTGGLLAMTVLATYVLARTFMGTWPALLVAAPIALAIGPLSKLLVDVRDFSKAPFVILLVALCLRLLTAPRQQVLPIAAAASLIASIGIGFRSDVSLFLVLVPAALLLRMLDRRSTGVVLASLAAFAAIAIAWTVLVFDYTPGLGRNNPHFVVLGQTSSFVKGLGFGEEHQGSLYFYNDHYVYRIVSSYAQAKGEPPPGYDTPEYDRVGRAFLIDLASTFPANQLIAGITAAYRSVMGFLGRTDIFPALAFLASALVLAWRFGWPGVAAIGLIGLLGGICGVQFDLRHYFHLNIVGFILCALLALVAAEHVVRRMAAKGLIETAFADRLIAISLPWPPASRGDLALVVLACVVLTWPLVAITRAYQDRQITATLATIGTFPREELTSAANAIDGGKAGGLRFDVSALRNVTYVAVAQEPRERCARLPRIAVRYAFADPYHDFSFRLKAPLGRLDGAFFPVPSLAGHNTLSSITVDDIEPGCTVRAWSVKPNARFLPLIYFSGDAPAASYHASPLLEGPVDVARQLYLRIAPRDCVLQRAKVRGGQPAMVVERTIAVPRFLSFTVDPDIGGNFSDHLDLGNAEIRTEGETIRLADLALIEATRRPYEVRRNVNIAGKPLQIGERVFEHGIGAHAPARFTFALPAHLHGAKATLGFHYGIDAQTAGAGSVALSACLLN